MLLILQILIFFPYNKLVILRAHHRIDDPLEIKIIKTGNGIINRIIPWIALRNTDGTGITFQHEPHICSEWTFIGGDKRFEKF